MEFRNAVGYLGAGVMGILFTFLQIFTVVSTAFAHTAEHSTSADTDFRCSEALQQRMVKVEEESFLFMALQNEIPALDEVLVSFGSSPNAAVPKGQPLEMLVWNVFKAKRPQLLPDLKTFSEKANFLVIQEAIVNRRISKELSLFKDYSWENALSFFQRNGDGTGVATGSTYTIKDVGFVRSSGREPITNTPKMALFTEYEIAGRPETLLIANLHALNFVPNSKFQQQLSEVGDNIANHQGPLIVTGDFNTHHKDRHLIMAKLAERLGASIVPLRNDRRLLRLDHVMVRGLTVLDAEVVTTVSSSDHLPVRLKFKI